MILKIRNLFFYILIISNFNTSFAETKIKILEKDKKIEREKIKLDFKKRHIVAKLYWFIKIKQYDLVWGLLKKLETQFPTAYETYYFKAWYFYYKKEYLKSFLKIDKALKENPNYAPAWNLRGILLSFLDKESEAELAYEKATQNNIYHSDYHYNLAYSLYKNKKDKKALKVITKVIYLKPNSASAFYLKALIYEKQKELFKSLAAFTLAEDFGLKGKQFYLDFASVIVQLNLKEELLRLTKKLSKSKSQEINFLRKLEKLWSYLGKTKKALALQKALVTHSKASYSDRKRLVYLLEKLHISSSSYIQKMKIHEKEKKLLKIYAYSCRRYQKQQAILKSIDPIID